MDLLELRVVITGRVQGVGFRYFTKKNATSLDVEGWVKNLSNGKVEALLRGEESNVDQLIDKLRKGPTPASVEDVNIVEKKKLQELTHQPFRIER